MLYLPWVTSSIFFVSVEFTLLSCLFYSLFNPELAFHGLLNCFSYKCLRNLPHEKKAKEAP
ncbi:MAG: hypothetical protein LBV62_01340 [Rickettsiales bacterium]|nr:hypothetical protein [Rickettsiales bacterium]